MDAAIKAVSTMQPQGPRMAEPALRTGAFTPAIAPVSKVDSRLAAERSVERDAATDSLVYRLVDLNSGVVTIQTPSDAQLKLRAYIDGVMARQADPSIEVTA